MGLFNKIKNIFKKEESLKEEVIPQDKLVHQKIDGKRDLDFSCNVCTNRIGAERYTYRNGLYFHKNCFKRAMRNVMAGKSING
jgi:hypothetical protein